MTPNAIDRFWELLSSVFALQGDAFRLVVQLPHGSTVAAIIVLAAGLSQEIAQSIILFINQVKPIRFIFSLLLNAVLFTAGYLFLVFSTWAIGLVPGLVQVPFGVLAIAIAIGYAPLIFSFLGSLPYLGIPILSLLSVWHLLTLVVGLATITGLEISKAFGYVALGWLVLQVLQRTVGQPIANLGRWLMNKTAGVELVRSQRELMNLVITGRQGAFSPMKEEMRQRITEIRQASIAHSLPQVVQNTTEEQQEHFSSPSGSSSSRTISWQPSGFFKGAERGFSRTIKTLFGLLGIALVSFLVSFLFRPLREWLFGSYNSLPELLQLLLNLVWIAVVAIVVAGLLAPLETLGWWAGWYEDEIDTNINAGILAEPIADPKKVSRYVVYLDGIAKSTFEYLPDVEKFLKTLASTLPDGVALIRGIVPYSVLNNPLDEDRPLAFLWRIVDKARLGNPATLLGMLINLRNVLIVAVSADKRYGPLYNQGIAQVIYNGLINNGYQPDSGIPITLIGFSGGGQMSAACAPFLTKALNAPIDVISLGGVISGNCNILKLEHLYHLVGNKDRVERLGLIMFPGRWKIFPLSYWNRAKRRGKITLVSLGPVGHQVPGGLMDPCLILPDGRTALEQTIDYITTILRGELHIPEEFTTVKSSNYEIYQQAAFNRPDYYPIHQSISPELYRPIGIWMGRLILPKRKERQRVRGALFEVYHGDELHQHLVGQIVNLRWNNEPIVQKKIRAAKRDVHFSAEASYTSKYDGLIHPERLNHWLQVDPLESLAGSHPNDDIIVMLEGEVASEESLSSTNLYISNQPVQISGPFYGLVKFLEPLAGSDSFEVVHFNRISRQFDGTREIVRMPQVVADRNGCFPSTSRDIEKSPLNETGWYIYGAKDTSGLFVVRSLAPRALFRLQPDEVILGKKSAYHYIRKQAWADPVAQKGRISSVLLHSGRLTKTAKSDSDGINPSVIQEAIPLCGCCRSEQWQEGDRALVLHVYGGIGGNKREPAAATPFFFGHFAYGMAKVVREPLTDELRFDILYYQVYTHNTDGLTAGVFHWSRYLGDRQFGWVGVRPVADILIKLDAFTGYYNFDGVQRSPFDLMLAQLEVMTSRYRIGDGTGGTYVDPANNCAQDSNRALFASLRQMELAVRAHKDWLREWGDRHPEQARRFRQLIQLEKALKRELQPLGNPRSDWERNEYNLGSTLEDEPLRNLIAGLTSWRTMLPRLASDTVVKIFLEQGASVWVLRTNQIGGYDPDIEPIAPMTL
ncbi:CAAX protease [Pleurocapsales cyanobacterium LEGE 06147]|nr:CAAX protease [Pleurocapsales cyanobacterium LEGE 06147]